MVRAGEAVRTFDRRAQSMAYGKMGGRPRKKICDHCGGARTRRRLTARERKSWPGARWYECLFCRKRERREWARWYVRTARGKRNHRAAVLRYRQSAKGRKTMRRWRAKRARTSDV